MSYCPPYFIPFVPLFLPHLSYLISRFLLTFLFYFLLNFSFFFSPILPLFFLPFFSFFLPSFLRYSSLNPSASTPLSHMQKQGTPNISMLSVRKAASMNMRHLSPTPGPSSPMALWPIDSMPEVGDIRWVFFYLFIFIFFLIPAYHTLPNTRQSMQLLYVRSLFSPLSMLAFSPSSYPFHRLSYYNCGSDEDFHFDLSDQPEGDSRPVDLQTFKVRTCVTCVCTCV